MGSNGHSECHGCAGDTLASSMVSILRLPPTPMPKPLPIVAVPPRKSPFTRSWLSIWRPSSSARDLQIDNFPPTSRKSYAPTLTVASWQMDFCGCGVKTALTSV